MLKGVKELIDESHFHVMIVACPRCSQNFIWVFTETIDWDDGDDPQYWQLLPITRTEADNLVLQEASLTEGQLNALGRDRSSLRHDHPKGTAPRTSWGTGLFIGHHD